VSLKTETIVTNEVLFGEKALSYSTSVFQVGCHGNTLLFYSQHLSKNWHSTVYYMYVFGDKV